MPWKPLKAHATVLRKELVWSLKSPHTSHNVPQRKAIAGSYPGPLHTVYNILKEREPPAPTPPRSSRAPLCPAQPRNAGVRIRPVEPVGPCQCWGRRPCDLHKHRGARLAPRSLTPKRPAIGLGWRGKWRWEEEEVEKEASKIQV